MDSHFASPLRTGAAELQREIETVLASPVIQVLLESVSGMVAILDANRQVVAMNDGLMAVLGIEDPYLVLGLRPGEALECLHANDCPGGCGTSAHCATCGAAVAIVSCLGLETAQERTCALTTLRDGLPVETCLLVRASPVEISGDRYVFLFLRDVTAEWYRAALEKTFFHDIRNFLGSLTSASSLLSCGYQDPDLIDLVRRSAQRIASEVSIQATLRSADAGAFNTTRTVVDADTVLDELATIYRVHPLARNRTIRVRESEETVTLATDLSLLLRVLGNMMTNALEATDPGGHVEVRCEAREGRIDLCVWNGRFIEDDVALRIFQRHFSTKAGEGRGLGTYSMKLFGEQILGGNVSFTTSRETGTEFRLSLPAPLAF